MRMLLLLGCILSQWVSATTLVVGIEAANNAPFEYADDSGQLTGFHVEVLRAVSRQLGWELSLERTPWKRTMLRLEHGEVQAVSYVAKSPEREAFAIFLPGNQLHKTQAALFILRSRATDIHFNVDLEQMARRWRLGTPSGYYVNDEVAALIKRGVPIAQPTVPQSRLFRMLMANRFDAIFGSTTTLQTTKDDIPNIEQVVQRLDGSRIPGVSMYLAFSRQAPAQLAEDFAKAYRLFRQKPEYLALAQRFGVTELLPTAEDFK
jgi:polar amino acid transport system substrate-binding protein